MLIKFGLLLEKYKEICPEAETDEMEMLKEWTVLVTIRQEGPQLIIDALFDPPHE